MRNFASTLVKFSKLSHIQTTIWRPPKMAPPRTAGSAGPFVTPLVHSMSLSMGVPQGSFLGPLLFILVIHDMQFCIKHSIIRFFADDTRILKHISCQKHVSELQEDLKNKQCPPMGKSEQYGSTRRKVYGS